jgi:transposase
MSPREAELTQQLEQVLQTHAALQRENRLLREKVNLLLRRVFGASSEKMDVAQLQLLLSGAELVEPAAEQKAEVPKPKAAAPAPRKTKLPRLPETLPLVEEIIDPEPVKAAPEQFRQIGEEVSEQLDYEPARYFRRRMVRRTYVSRAEPEKAPVTAPLPPTLQERCIATPALLAQVVVSKYCDHLPLYPAGTDFGPTVWNQSAAPDTGPVGGVGLGVAHPDLSTDQNRSHGRRLCPVGRNADRLSGAGSRPSPQKAIYGRAAVLEGTCFFDWHPSRAGECFGHRCPGGLPGHGSVRRLRCL